jgi:hypothetical protein
VITGQQRDVAARTMPAPSVLKSLSPTAESLARLNNATDELHAVLSTLIDRLEQGGVLGSDEPKAGENGAMVSPIQLPSRIDTVANRTGEAIARIRITIDRLLV